MSNVVATLFTDIADAIRSKTGGTNKIAPANFPTEISNIVVGRDSGDTEWKFASGTSTSTGGTLTIAHNLGAVPDIIYAVSSSDTSGTVSYLGGIGFSDAMIEAFGNNDMVNNQHGVQVALAAFGPMLLSPEEGVDGAHSSLGGMYGFIRNANSSTFQVGGGSVTPIPSGRSVNWWAVSGIV